jgi:hypothetical protein
MELDRLVRELTKGATEMVPPSRYKGLWFRRSDGTIIGLRRSKQSGLTIDIVDSLGHHDLEPGLRIHSDD